MNLKGIVVVALAVLIALIGWAWASRPSPVGFLSDLLVNFASEAFGFVLTVFLVNFLLHRHHLETEARHLARSILHDIDHAVWVWLGGKREFGLAESRALLQKVDAAARPVRFTESLLIAIGSRAAGALRTHSQVVERQPVLLHALETLVPLAGLRDGPPGSSLHPAAIAAILIEAEQPLCAAGRVAADILSAGAPLNYDPSEAGQRWRHSGEI